MNQNKFMYTVFSLGFFILISTGVYLNHTHKSSADQMKNPLDENLLYNKPLESKSCLMIGIDKSGNLTDVLMLAYIDVESNSLKIVSIPRDLLIDFREEPFKTIKDNNPNSRARACKLNEMYFYFGKDEAAMNDLKEVISIITDIKIDYLTTININGFKHVVDTIGGVDFEVPQNMYYKDPSQDLLINLKKGYQHLDGDKAEQLVRFRRYIWGDLERVKVQREFLSVLLDKIVQANDWGKIMSILETLYKYIETDVQFLDILSYSKYIMGSNNNQLLTKDNMMTIPATPKKIDGIEYLTWDLEKTKKLVNDFIYNKTNEENGDSESSSDEENAEEGVYGKSIEKNNYNNNSNKKSLSIE